VLPDGEDTLFPCTSLSWCQVLWTPPEGGNAYYILAHAYIPAVLNGLAGADTSAVNDEMAEAAGLLALCVEPEEPLRSEFIAIAEVLDDYNNGLMGVPHCDNVPAIEPGVYDALTYGGNGNCVIDKGEAIHAIRDYFDIPPVLNMEEVLAVLICYFSQTEFPCQ